MARGRYDGDKAACPTLAELERWLTVAIAEFHHLQPRAGLDGEAPLRRHREGVRALASQGRAPPSPRDLRAFPIDVLPVVRRTLRRDGVVIDHVHHFSDALKPWTRRSATPLRVLIRRDPRDLSHVYVLDPDDGGHLEVPYRKLSRPPVSLWEHRLARGRLRQRHRGEMDEGALFAAIEEMLSHRGRGAHLHAHHPASAGLASWPAHDRGACAWLASCSEPCTARLVRWHGWIRRSARALRRRGVAMMDGEMAHLSAATQAIADRPGPERLGSTCAGNGGSTTPAPGRRSTSWRPCWLTGPAASAHRTC